MFVETGCNVAVIGHNPPMAEASQHAALHHLGWLLLCEQLAGHLQTPMAKAALEREQLAVWEGGVWGLASGDTPAFERTTKVGRARELLRELDGLERMYARAANAPHGDDEAPRTARSFASALAEVTEIDQAISHARAGSLLNPTVLLGVSRQLRAVAIAVELCVYAQEHEPEHPGVRTIAKVVDQLLPLRSLAEDLRRAIAPAGPGGEPWVVDHASPELHRARTRVRSLRQAIVRRAEKMLRTPTIAECLQDRYWTEREGRMVLPVRSDAYSKGGAVAGIIHSSSGRGTLFVEPAALVEDNNSLRAAQAEAKREERKVLEQLTSRVGEHAEALEVNQRILVQLDFVHARLKLSDSIEGVAPRLLKPKRRKLASDEQAENEPADDRRLVLPGVRHPLMLLSGVDVVPNDVSLHPGQALIISGPNAGGKTVSLKTLGLCVLMAQAGVRLPTKGRATLPLYRHVVTDVGDDQSISKNLSTFSAHIRHVQDALKSAAQDPAGTLVLLDEIAVGTEPIQGAALAESVLIHLVDRGATVVCTTHYERLKLLAADRPQQFANAAVGFDIDRMEPTFRLTLGLPGASSALAVAKRLGLPTEVLDDAEARVAQGTLRVDTLMRELQDAREKLMTTREKLEADRAELKRRIASVQARETAALNKARSRKQKAYDEAVSELHGLRGELSRQRKALRKRGENLDKQAIDEVADTLRRAKSDLAEAREPAKKAPGKPPPKVVVGERVHVTTIDAAGEVVEVKRDKVVVSLGTVRTTVPLSALRSLAQQRAPKTKVKSTKAQPIHTWSVKKAADRAAAEHFGDAPKPVGKSIDNCVDVRGQRADEVELTLDKFLSVALQRDQDVVVIAHGYGSGALRTVVRKYLKRQDCVREFREGLAKEGGNGCTVAWLQ